MHLEFLVEEESAEAALRNLVPRIAGPEVTYEVHPFRGKAALLRGLLPRLRAYKAWLPDDWRIVVLIDQDNSDCTDLKRNLEDKAREAGLVTKTAAGSSSRFQVLNRVAVEELEAWFFGDLEAVAQAYPEIPRDLNRQAKYRHPDRIAGGTWEALERVLDHAGYYPGGKIAMAQAISVHMDPDRNASPSFRVFRDALRELVGA